MLIMWYKKIIFLSLSFYAGIGLSAENKYKAETCAAKLKELTVVYWSNQGDTQASMAKNIFALMAQCPYPREHLAGYASALTFAHCLDQAEQCKQTGNQQQCKDYLTCIEAAMELSEPSRFFAQLKTTINKEPCNDT